MELHITKEDVTKIKEAISLKESKLAELGLGLGDAMSRTGSFPASSPEYAAVHLDIQNLQQSIDYFKEILNKYQIVDIANSDHSKINVYSEVIISKNGKSYYFYIGLNEIYHDIGPEFALATPESPIGKALVGHQVGDRVEVLLPSGAVNYEVVRHTVRL